MKNQKCIVYCKTASKRKQAYYLQVNKQEYYLFSQNYRKSNKEFFGNGILLNAALDYAASKSTSVRRTITKLIPHIKYIEKIYGLIILRKTYKAKFCNLKRLHYNRMQFKNVDSVEFA